MTENEEKIVQFAYCTMQPLIHAFSCKINLTLYIFYNEFLHSCKIISPFWGNCSIGPYL